MKSKKTISVNWLLVSFSVCLIAIPLGLIQIYDNMLYDIFHKEDPNYYDNPNRWIGENLFIEDIFLETAEYIDYLDQLVEKEGVDIEIFNANSELIYKSRQTTNRSIVDDEGDLTTETSYKTTVSNEENQPIGYIYTTPDGANYTNELPTSNESVVVFILFIVIFVILLIFLVLVKNEMIKPIVALNKASIEISNGNHSIKTNTSRVKEINELTASYEKMNDNLVSLKKQRSEYENDRNLFVSSIVHDLRTPLFGLKGYLEGLTSGIANNNEKRERYLNKALKQALRMDDLVSSLTNYNRSFFLSEHSSKEKIELNKLVEEVLTGLDYQKNKKELRFIPKIDKVLIFADYFLLYQAIENIIANAIRFSPIKGTIYVGVGKTEENWAKIVIKDEGPGVEETMINNIFKPLYQIDQSRKYDGHIGLGLAISKKNIESQGGIIKAVNSKDKGLEIEVLLRVNKFD
ncbi:two-component sensor kinase [Bacillus sp. JCM 19046]|nr:two-component sensor kinase [Bacillus sp. JCM 19045]GAF20271.1 two-component sensor kinase [Bacillus sp. JCM 19046]